MDHYDYPDVLFCMKCDTDVTPKIEERTEPFIRNGKDVEVPYKIAICPTCGEVLCDRDVDFAIIRLAREDGLMK